jgi:hypothetical protein
VSEFDVGPAPGRPDLVISFLPDELPSCRELMEAAECGLIELSGRRELLDTVLRLFTIAQPA